METVGLKLGGLVLSQGGKLLWQGVSEEVRKKVKPTDFEKAIADGFNAAEAWDSQQELQQHLFYRCDDGQKQKCLHNFLTNSATITELQKPISDKGIPDTKCLIHVFRESARATQTKLVEATVEDWINTFARAYFEATKAAIQFRVCRQRYLQQFVCHFDDVKFAGIRTSTQERDRSAKLQQIFVMPNVREELSDRASASEMAFELLERENRQTRLLEEQRQLARRDRSGRTFSAQQLFQNNTGKRVVLLGDPGSGKTTLLSYFGVAVADDQLSNVDATGLDEDTDWLPILIRIRDWSRHGEDTPLDYARRFAEKTLQVQDIPTGFFEYWLETGRALILLDGLDEVASEATRYEVVQCIENFLEKPEYRNNPAVITSRPAGYKRDFFRTEAFPHYWLEEFNDEQIQAFIQHWYEDRIRDPEERQRSQDSLQEALNRSDRVKSLARNPLLLTIIALIHRYEAHLPKQRHKLYARAVETLLTNWDSYKSLPQESLKYLDSDDWQRLMEIVAYWIHSEGSTDDRSGGTLIDRDELTARLAQEIKRLKQVELHQAKQEASRFLDYVRERTGLLNEQGQDCFAFVHKTFQEYLAAQDVQYRADEDYDFDIVLDTVRDRLHDPHWREVLLLLVAQQKPRKATRAIEAILQCGSPYEQWLHRDLFFAASCLAEDPENLRSAGTQLSDEILERLVALEVGEYRTVCYQVREAVFETLQNLRETTFELDALARLKDCGDAISGDRLVFYQFHLGEAQAAIDTLLARLNDDGSSYVRGRAAGALGLLGQASEGVVSALLARLNDDGSSYVRGTAAWALGLLGQASEGVVSALLARLNNDDSAVRGMAAWALGQLGQASEEVVSALLSRLNDDDSFVRGFAAGALDRLGQVTEEVMSALLARLNHDDSSVRLRAAGALGRLGQTSEEVVSALLARLNHDDSFVRGFAAGSLGLLGQASEGVVSALLARLNHDDSSVRRGAAEALGLLGQASEGVVSALLARLNQDDSSVRRGAAEALGQLGQASEGVVSALLARLNDDDSAVRGDAARALGRLGRETQEVVPQLVNWIEQHPDRPNLGAGIDALWLAVVESS